VEQRALIPIPAPWRPRRRRNPTEPHWSRWQGPATSCDDCVKARAGLNRPDTDLLRGLWRVEHEGRVALVCSVHAARRGR
jgi:hypothetical protein